MDSPQNVTLQRDFASKLFCFLRMGCPSAELRAKLWRRLLPPLAPVAQDVGFTELGRRFDLNAGGIRNAVARAAAEAEFNSRKPDETPGSEDTDIRGAQIRTPRRVAFAAWMKNLVDDLVADVDGGAMAPQGDLHDLDGAIDSSAEAPGIGQEDAHQARV